MEVGAEIIRVEGDTKETCTCGRRGGQTFSIVVVKDDAPSRRTGGHSYVSFGVRIQTLISRLEVGGDRELNGVPIGGA
jgi:hypothetical protein